MDESALAKLYAKLTGPAADHSGPCPPASELVRLALDELPPDRRGVLQREVEACVECAGDLARLQSALLWYDAKEGSLLAGARARTLPPTEAAPGPLARATMHLTENAQGLADFVRRVIDGIRDLADAQAPTLAMRPGYRAATADTIHAAVAGPAGSPAPATPFRVVRAEIEADGRLVLDISTTASVPKGVDRVQATLQVGDARLVLPPAELFTDGRATVVARLPIRGRAVRIPVGAIEVILTSSGPGS